MSNAKNNNAGDIARRSFLTGAAAMLAGIMLGAKAAGQQPSSKTYEFTDGQWFDG